MRAEAEKPLAVATVVPVYTVFPAATVTLDAAVGVAIRNRRLKDDAVSAAWAETVVPALIVIAPYHRASVVSIQR